MHSKRIKLDIKVKNSVKLIIKAIFSGKAIIFKYLATLINN